MRKYTRMQTTTDQRRAKAGGELGANGEWYEGGKFIATQEDTVKTAPALRPASRLARFLGVKDYAKT